jgi:GxxExxY protein
MNMEPSDAPRPELQYGRITENIIGCAFEVINELGAGFLESVYERALAIALSDKGLKVQCQYPAQVYFRNRVVGNYYADLLIEGKVVVELKAVKALIPEHQAQVINYLKATGLEVALLVNFGNPKLEFKRLTRMRQLI